jgi:ABC-2 type transport system permease protein
LKSVKLFSHFIKSYLKTKLEYRFAFFTELLAQAIIYLGIFVSIWIIYSRFPLIQGWDFNSVLLLYNFNMFSFSVSGLIFWSPLRNLEQQIISGDFDVVLTKPMNPLLYLLSKNFNHVYLGTVFLGVGVFIYLFIHLNIEWTIFAVIFFIINIFGSILIQSSIMIFTGSFSFFTGKSSSLAGFAIYGFRRYIDYPITYFSKFVQIILTFVLPYAFINFYPTLNLIDHESINLINPILPYISSIVGLVLFILAYRFWLFGLQRYKSGGG